MSVVQDTLHWPTIEIECAVLNICLNIGKKKAPESGAFSKKSKPLLAQHIDRGEHDVGLVGVFNEVEANIRCAFPFG
jgi:hypothetical protein